MMPQGHRTLSFAMITVLTAGAAAQTPTFTPAPTPTHFAPPLGHWETLDNSHTRWAYLLAYDTDLQRAYIYGGRTTWGRYVDPMMEWWQGHWTPIQSAHLPQVGVNGSMTYDAARKECLAFGGWQEGGGSRLYDETWIWKNRDWTRRQPAASPSQRAFQAMTYDAAHECVLLFGGVGSANARLDDTWSWDGSNWTQLYPAHHPPAGTNPQMVYDAHRGRVVLFTSIYPQGESASAQTWEWDGVDWTRMTPVNSPGPRLGAALVYCPPLQAVLLFGGFGGPPAAPPSGTYYNDLWIYDGSAWKRVDDQSAARPIGRNDVLLFWDPFEKSLVLTSGWSLRDGLGDGINDLWRYVLDPALFETPTPTATPTSTPTPTLVPPPNDTRANAEVVTTMPFTRVVDTRGATRSPDDPLQPCTFGGAYANSRTVWYGYSPVATGKADVFAGGYDTVVSVWRSDGCAALNNLVACVDAFGRMTPEQFSFAVVEGHTYLIEVAAYGEGLGGDLVFSLQGPAATVPAGATCSPTPTPTPAGGGGAVGGATPVAPTATVSVNVSPSPTPTVTPGSGGGIVEDATPTATPKTITSAPDYNHDGRVDILDLMLLLDTRQKPPDSSQSAADSTDYRDILRLAEWWGRVVGGRP